MKFWWESILKPKRNPERDLQVLVEALKGGLGSRLTSVLVFGSMARGEFDPERSNVNVLIVMAVAYENLVALGAALAPWLKKGHLPPVLVAPDELDDYARDFPIEFLDMRDSHRVLCGEDPLTRLTVDRRHLESQCEHDLSLTELRLRQAIAAAAGKPPMIRRALLKSLPSVSVLVRSVVRLEENTPSVDANQGVQRLAARAGFDRAVLQRVSQARFRRGNDDVADLAVHYLQLISAVLTYLRKR